MKSQKTGDEGGDFEDFEDKGFGRISGITVL